MIYVYVYMCVPVRVHIHLCTHVCILMRTSSRARTETCVHASHRTNASFVFFRGTLRTGEEPA